MTLIQANFWFCWNFSTFMNVVGLPLLGWRRYGGIAAGMFLSICPNRLTLSLLVCFLLSSESSRKNAFGEILRHLCSFTIQSWGLWAYLELWTYQNIGIRSNDGPANFSTYCTYFDSAAVFTRSRGLASVFHQIYIIPTHLNFSLLENLWQEPSKDFTTEGVDF